MGLFSKPKKAAKTGEEKAAEIRTRSLLDKEIGEEEDRFKLLARGKLGRSSLLSGAPRNISEAASGSRRGGAGGAGSLLGGSVGGGRSGSGGGGSKLVNANRR